MRCQNVEGGGDEFDFDEDVGGDWGGGVRGGGGGGIVCFSSGFGGGGVMVHGGGGCGSGGRGVEGLGGTEGGFDGVDTLVAEAGDFDVGANFSGLRGEAFGDIGLEFGFDDFGREGDFGPDVGVAVCEKESIVRG